MPWLLVEQSDQELLLMHSDDLPNKSIPALLSFAVVSLSPPLRVFVWDANESKSEMEDALVMKRAERLCGTDEVNDKILNFSYLVKVQT